MRNKSRNNIVINRTVQFITINMNTYSSDMYNEILEYENFRYGKFLEIPYPIINNSNKLHHGTKQQSDQITRASD